MLLDTAWALGFPIGLFGLTFFALRLFLMANG
jgi:hypothetical protein